MGDLEMSSGEKSDENSRALSLSRESIMTDRLGTSAEDLRAVVDESGY